MSQTHTSGPWSKTISNEIAAGVGYDRIIIARTAKKANGQELPQAANAQIMACSLDLFEFAKKFVKLFCSSDMGPEDECHELYAEAKEIIDRVGRREDDQGTKNG